MIRVVVAGNQLMIDRISLANQRVGGLLCLVIAVCIGCESPEVSEASAASAQKSYDQAVTAFESGSYPEARSAFDEALTGGGLTVDQLVDAHLKRSMCLATAGDYSAAEQDIERAAEGATDLEWVHVARGYLKAQQGDTSGAEAEYRQARSINPKVVIPKR